MRTLFTLLVALLSLSAQAQLSTNIQIKVTVTVTNPGVSTNASNSTVTLDPGTPKDLQLINGSSFAYFSARSNGETNTMDFWMAKTHFKDKLKADADAYNNIIYQTIRDNIDFMLQFEPDVIQSDIPALTTIANKRQ